MLQYTPTLHNNKGKKHTKNYLQVICPLLQRQTIMEKLQSIVIRITGVCAVRIQDASGVKNAFSEEGI
jgi:hypothetical protein